MTNKEHPITWEDLRFFISMAAIITTLVLIGVVIEARHRDNVDTNIPPQPLRQLNDACTDPMFGVGTTSPSSLVKCYQQEIHDFNNGDTLVIDSPIFESEWIH